MHSFHFLRKPDINAGITKYSEIPGAVLLDIRTEQEYREGHIPGSINLPPQELDNAVEIIENEDTPIYVYCRSGSRSRQAAAILGAMGYSDVTNIGGIAAWTGKVER